MRRAVGAVGVAAAALIAASVGACSGGAGGDDASRPDATLTTASSTTTTSTTALLDPFAIPADPADIDEEYVQGVVDALYEVDAAAAELILTSRSVSPEAQRILASVYEGEVLDLELQGWANLLGRPGSVESFRPGKHSLRHSLEDVLGRSETCLFVTATRSYEDVSVDPPQNQRVFLGLATKDVTDDPDGLNPTPWMVFTDGVQLDPAIAPENPCDD